MSVAIKLTNKEHRIFGLLFAFFGNMYPPSVATPQVLCRSVYDRFKTIYHQKWTTAANPLNEFRREFFALFGVEKNEFSQPTAKLQRAAVVTYQLLTQCENMPESTN